MIRRNTHKRHEMQQIFAILLLYHWHRFAIFLVIMNRSTIQRTVFNVYQPLSFNFHRFLCFMFCHSFRCIHSITFVIRSDERLKIGQFTRLAFAKSNKIANRVITTCSAPINHSANMRPDEQRRKPFGMSAPMHNAGDGHKYATTKKNQNICRK